MNVTRLCMISTRRSATWIICAALLMFYGPPTSPMGLDSKVCSIINILISVAHTFTGAQLLGSEQECLLLDHRYLRCVERYDIPGDDEFRLVICMTARMSSLLVQAKRIFIDTSFKRVRGWQEFEIEGWDNMHQRCNLFRACNRTYSNQLQLLSQHMHLQRHNQQILMSSCSVASST
jgi:hypothetical protein